MSIDVVRFGVGLRRPQGPEGSRNVRGVTIHGDARGTITELAFGREARLEPHESPDSAWFCVIEGGGWVLVGEETRRVASGEAVAWPAGVLHAAWTDHSQMRAVLVELAGPDDAALRGVLDERTLAAGADRPRQVERGQGSLALRELAPGPADRDGEPR